MVYRRIAGQFLRYLWLAFAVLVILYAILVVAGRELMPVIDRYQPRINAFLSDASGMDVDIGSLSGDWRAGRPLLNVRDVTITDPESGTPALTIDHLAAEINLLRTVASGAPAWQELQAQTINVELVEDEHGRWTLAGYPLGLSSGGTGLETLFDLLYHSRFLRIDQLVVDLSFYGGTDARFYARDLQVENARGFHRTIASIALSREGQNIADFVFEGRGDPADTESFRGEGFLHLQRLNMEGSLQSLVSAWFPGLSEELGKVETALDFSFWFDWENRSLRNGRGDLRAAELPLVVLPEAPALTNVRAEVTGWFQPGRDWGFAVRKLSGRWGDTAIEPVDFRFRQRVGRRWGDLDIAVNHLDLAVVADTVLNTNVLGERGREALSSLRPSGQVRRLFLDINVTEGTPKVRFRANMEDLALESWRNAPAVKGLDGYVESDLATGFVILDSAADLALHYPQAYDDYMSFGETRGKVAWHWQRDRQRVLVTSNRIAIEGEAGRANALLHLDLPTVKGGNPEMILMVGMRDSHTRYVDRYLPRVLNKQLTAYLERAVGDGKIPEAGFIWRGSLKGQFHTGRSIQVFARLVDGTIDYREGWPAAEQVTASLVVNNGEMDALIASATVAGETVEDLGVSVRGTEDGPLLRVAGDVATTVPRGLEILSRSPLGDRLADVTGLDAEGAVDVDLDLRIPLAAGKTGEEYRVIARLREVTLGIPGTGFEISRVHGPLRLDGTGGVSSEGLSGELWGKPLSVTVESGPASLNISGEGSLGSSGLETLLGHYGDYIQGETAVTAELSLSLDRAAPHLLTLGSDLKGLEVALPAPFAKSGPESLASEARLEIAGGAVRIRGNLGDWVAAAGVVEGETLVRGTVALLAESASPPPGEMLLISGRLPETDWSDWEPVVSGSGERRAFPPGIADRVRLDLAVKELVIRGFSLGQTRLRGRPNEAGGWALDLASQQAAGRVVAGNGASPPQLDLDYLKLPSLGEAGAPWAQFSPGDIPEFDLSVQDLSYGGAPLGRISFKSRRLSGGVAFTDIEGKLGNIAIRPQPLPDGEEVDRAELRWTATESGQRSYFSGTLEMGDIESVLARWDIPAPLSSEHATLYANLGWKGNPGEINTLGLDGYLGIDLRNGQFYEKRAGAANAFLKLVGLINFDAWLRRLRFDFSDFFSQGLSYDRVEGGLVFRRGLVDFDDPIAASMPSGRIRLSGSVDLIYEQLDAKLIATMPVGTNLPWVAGLLGGLPAAAGVFLTSKLFAKQVDRLSSIGYKVTGPLEDPKIEVERIFTDPTKMSTN